MQFRSSIVSANLVLLLALSGSAGAQAVLGSPCPRPQAGSVIDDPPRIGSRQGVLATTLVARNVGAGPEGSVQNYGYRFCLLEQDNPQRQSPVLRVRPGDRVKLKLLDQMSDQPGFPVPHVHAMPSRPPHHETDQASIATVNLHYHGLNIPPKRGADDVLTTIIQPDDGTSQKSSQFTYDFRIPPDDPPGLFWYHPHIHGIAQQQILGGMTGVMIIEGMEKFFPQLKELRERVLVLRDMDKPDPADDPTASPDEPWKNVSLNSVPIVYGSDLIPKLEMGAGERQFWRVANASADTHFVLQVQFNPTGGADGWEMQDLELIARDGIPIVAGHGTARGRPFVVKQIVLPPAGRAEFIVTGPPAGVAARFFSADYNGYLSPKSADCAPEFPDSACDNTDRNPAWTLARIVTTSAPTKQTIQTTTPKAEPGGRRSIRRFAGFLKHRIDKRRTVFFTKDPRDDGNFFVTVAGRTPKPFDMAGPPDITVQGPTVEEWTIENRDNESHDFHIHQIHFLVEEINGVPAGDASKHVLRDTIELGSCRKWADGIDPQNDPYGLAFPPGSPLNDSGFTGKNCLQPAIVKLRMNFLDRNIVGTFLYHCHIMEHEDGGMMAKIRLK